MTLWDYRICRSQGDCRGGSEPSADVQAVVTTLVTTQRCLPIWRSRVKPASFVGRQGAVEQEAGGHLRAALRVSLDHAATRLSDQVQSTSDRSRRHPGPAAPLAHVAAGVSTSGRSPSPFPYA